MLFRYTQILHELTLFQLQWSKMRVTRQLNKFAATKVDSWESCCYYRLYLLALFIEGGL